MKDLILTSPTTSKDISQSSIFYLKAFLPRDGVVDILDLSGTVDFYDPPNELLDDQARLWHSDLVFDESWIDDHIPECGEQYGSIFASALFSMDIVLQGRYVRKCKEAYPGTRAVIGGPAIRSLDANQLKVVSSVFDVAFAGSLPVWPDYISDSYKLKGFVTVATGTGCDWGMCRFCNSGKEKYSLRNLDEVVEDLARISEVSDSEVMLSSDSIPIPKINGLSLKLINAKNKQKYNLMMRACLGVDEAFSENLKRSGCTDVFVGGEILDDAGLHLVNKGTTVAAIKNTVRNLGDSGINVQLGLILFLPRISEKQLENQLRNLEELLPYVNKVELESLSVLHGSDFYENYASYGIDLYPEKNLIFPAWCYGLSPDVPWGFKDDADYFVWEKHIDSLRQVADDYVDERYWWHVDYIKENWE